MGAVSQRADVVRGRAKLCFLHWPLALAPHRAASACCPRANPSTAPYCCTALHDNTLQSAAAASALLLKPLASWQPILILEPASPGHQLGPMSWSRQI